MVQKDARQLELHARQVTVAVEQGLVSGVQDLSAFSSHPGPRTTNTKRLPVGFRVLPTLCCGARRHESRCLR